MVGSTWNFQELLSLAYFIPQNGKEVFLAKEKYLSLWQALYFELFKNHSVWKKYTVGKRIVLSFFNEKNYRAWDTFLFKKKSNKSGQKNWRWRSLTIFTKEATLEQGQNVWGASAAVARLDRTSLARGRAVDDHRIEFSVRSIEATVAVDRARRAQLIELAVCRRCPAKLPFLPAVTAAGHTWRENAPQSPKKIGVVDIARIPKAWPPQFDFGEEGRPSHDFSYFSIPFLPWVFHR